MIEIEILDAKKNKMKWLGILNKIPESKRDIFFYPDFIEMSCHEKNSKGTLFKFQKNNNIWIYPFIIKPIDELNTLKEKYYDIDTAYMYGGPLTNCEDEKFLNDANYAFSKWCKQKNIVSEFIRFHPLIENFRWVSPSTKIEYNRESVSVDLKKFKKKEISLNPKVLNMIRRVTKDNIKVTICDVKENFSNFLKIYILTMKKVKAEKFYLFNKKYFNNLVKLTDTSGWLIAAHLEDKWLGGAIFLKSNNKINYYLSATNPNFKRPGVTNAIIFKAIEEGVKRKFSILNLTGGISKNPQDSVLKFKKTMGTLINKYFIGKKVHNKKIYDLLKKNWSKKYPNLFSKYKDRVMCYRYTKDF